MASFTCPVDGATLVPIERQGIEIDHCPNCRGVWLDRGELDKIVERSAAPAPRDGYREPGRRYEDQRGHPPKRKRSFLEDLFD
jgi:Zn-finger nucleic acid-binding protein